MSPGLVGGVGRCPACGGRPGCGPVRAASRGRRAAAGGRGLVPGAGAPTSLRAVPRCRGSTKKERIQPSGGSSRLGARKRAAVIGSSGALRHQVATRTPGRHQGGPVTTTFRMLQNPARGEAAGAASWVRLAGHRNGRVEASLSPASPLTSLPPPGPALTCGKLRKRAEASQGRSGSRAAVAGPFVWPTPRPAGTLNRKTQRPKGPKTQRPKGRRVRARVERVPATPYGRPPVPRYVAP